MCTIEPPVKCTCLASSLQPALTVTARKLDTRQSSLHARMELSFADFLQLAEYHQHLSLGT